MKNKMMPINNMKYFEGSLLEVPFGFLFVEVSCPDNLHIPILQIHNKNRTVSPLGKFKGWFFSEELINARDNFGYKLFIQYIDENKIKNFNNDKMVGEINSNIAIAEAITAYSRMIMADIKLYCLNNNIKILYSDTDSIFTDKPLPDNLIGQGIGQWKLEALCKEAVFLAPKLYGYITKDGNEVVKCKGFKNNISFKELKSLLKLNASLELNQEKWFKSIELSNITIKDQVYTVKVTNNKRHLMYDRNKKLYNTRPFIF